MKIQKTVNNKRHIAANGIFSEFIQRPIKFDIISGGLTPLHILQNPNHILFWLFKIAAEGMEK